MMPTIEGSDPSFQQSSGLTDSFQPEVATVASEMAINESDTSSQQCSSPSENCQLEVATATPELGPTDIETGSIPWIELPAVNEVIGIDDTTTTSRKEGRIDVNIEAVAVVESVDGKGATTISAEDLESAPIARLVQPDDPSEAGPIASHEATNSQDDILQRRPEFISATLYKPEHDTPMGMGLASQGGEVLISSITPGALVSKAPFCVGDRLLSVNAKRCYIMDSKSVAQFMATLVGTVTIVVHNKSGDPNLVESMVTKPTNETICGLGLESSGHRNLKISNIFHDGLFFDSLLNVGDPLVSINGEDCRRCDVHDAGEIIRRGGRFITIKAETLLETGVVVAAFSCNNSTGSTIPPQIIAAFNKIESMSPSMASLIGLTVVAVSLVGLVMVAGYM